MSEERNSETILNILAQDKNMIPYRKELNQVTGNVMATILLQQIIYWWYQNDGKPFFKFKQPPYSAA